MRPKARYRGFLCKVYSSDIDHYEVKERIGETYAVSAKQAANNFKYRVLGRNAYARSVMDLGGESCITCYIEVEEA